VAEARQGITAYFEFYNYQRLHQTLAYRTPRQVFDEAAPLASSAPGQDFPPYDRPIAVSKIGSTSSFAGWTQLQIMGNVASIYDVGHN
jgi:hypothetical protein